MFLLTYCLSSSKTLWLYCPEIIGHLLHEGLSAENNSHRRYDV